MLTTRQMEQLDFVEGEIAELITNVTGKDIYDIELGGDGVDLIHNIHECICDYGVKKGWFTEMEFYPWSEDGN